MKIEGRNSFEVAVRSCQYISFGEEKVRFKKGDTMLHRIESETEKEMLYSLISLAVILWTYLTPYGFHPAYSFIRRVILNFTFQDWRLSWPCVLLSAVGSQRTRRFFFLLAVFLTGNVLLTACFPPFSIKSHYEKNASIFNLVCGFMPSKGRFKAHLNQFSILKSYVLHFAFREQ